MATRVTRSRTFAVVLIHQETLGAYFLWKRTSVESGEVSLEHTIRRTRWPVKDRDEVIELLKQAGLTVRYFDYEEHQWMDVSTAYGLVRAPGPRDGSWTFPELSEFEENYLQVV